MGEHAHLSAMVCFVSQHVAQHLRANRPGGSESVSPKHLDAATGTAECFSQHLGASLGTFSEGRARLLLSAMRAMELGWNSQVRGSEPDPLGANIVHMSKDGHNGAGLAGLSGVPRSGVKMLDEKLIHALVGGEHHDSNLSELRGKPGEGLASRRGHGC